MHLVVKCVILESDITQDCYSMPWKWLLIVNPTKVQDEKKNKEKKKEEKKEKKKG